jgi:hypothetical protein
VIDRASNAMATSTSTLTFEYDVTAPTAAITSANTDPTRVSPVMFTIVLSEVCETFAAEAVDAADAVSPYQF